MGNKSKMIGARGRTFGFSKRNNRNGGAFGSKRLRGYETVVMVKEKGELGWEKQIVAVSSTSKSAVYLRRSNHTAEI